MENITVKEALRKTSQATKDYIDNKIALTTEKLSPINYNLINNGKFKNCYVYTEDMIPSWICEPSLRVSVPPEESYCNCLELFNRSDTAKEIKQRVVLEPVSTYTLTFKASWQENVNGGVQARIDFYNDNNRFDNDPLLVARLTVPVANNENELQTLTFPTPSLPDYSYSEVVFIIGNTANEEDNIPGGGVPEVPGGGIASVETYTMARIGEVKLEEGDTYTGWRGSKRDEGIVINGHNLITNGDFSSYSRPTTITDWKINGDGVIWRYNGQEGYNKAGCIYFSHYAYEDVYSGFFQRIYNLKKRTEYTLTFYIGWEQNVRDFYVDLVFQNENNVSILDPVEFKPSRSGTYSYTFVTPDIDFHSMNVGFCHRGVTVEGESYCLGIAGNVKLVERSYADNSSNVNLDYISKTEFEQTNETLMFRIGQSGGGNLIKNSLFKNDTKYWYHLSFGDNMVETSMWPWEAWGEWNNNKYNALACFADIDVYGGQICAGFDTEWITVQPYATYSFSCWLQAHRVKDVNFEVWYDNGGTNTYLTGSSRNLTSVGTGKSWGQNYENWTRFETTFTVPSTKRIWLRIYMGNHDENSDQGNAYLWLAQPVLVEGFTPSKVWVPHESEIYDGIVKIDDGGIEVQHNSNKSVVLDNEALKFYNGSELYSKIDGGLFRIMKPEDSSSTIGSMGRFRWTYSGTCCTCLGAGLGHDVALGSIRDSGGTTTCGLVDSSQGGFLTGNTWYYEQGLNITRAQCGTLHFKGYKADTFSSQVESEVGALSLWAGRPSTNNSEGNTHHCGYIYGRDTLNFGIAYGPLKVAMEICETANASNNTAIHMYGPLNMHGYNISNAGWVNPVSASSEYTSRLLREGSIENINYGTLSYYEGEIRWCWKETVFTYAECDIDPATDEWVYTGRNICYVELPIFMAENIQNDYHVNVSKMSWGDYRIIEKNPYYFILESQEEDFAFTFEVVAKLVDGQTLSNNVSIASMSTSANPAVSVDPPTSEEIILQGNESLTS